MKVQWDISTCLKGIPNHRLNGSGGRQEQVLTSCSLLGYNRFMAVNSKQHHYCLFTFYLPPLFIYVDFDWWRHFIKGREKGGGGKEYFNCLVASSCKSTVHTARVLLNGNISLHIWGRILFLSPDSLLYEWLEVGCKQYFRSISNHIETANHTAISHENQHWPFLMKKC